MYISYLANPMVLYIGVTNDIHRRVDEHKKKLVKGFTQTYKVNRLVYIECHEDIESAILREKKLKNWRRQWKINLIEEKNPQWRDLYKSLFI